MVPFGDSIGELVINDTRGLLYLTDDKVSEPQVFLDLREEDVAPEVSVYGLRHAQHFPGIVVGRCFYQILARIR